MAPRLFLEQGKKIITVSIFHFVAFHLFEQYKDYGVQDDLLSDKGNSIFELEPKFNES